jgi:WD40 repeat protein
MGRTHFFITSSLLILIVILISGCGNSSPSGPINTDSRDYGPPFSPIVFDDGDGYLATVGSEFLTSDPFYVDGIGVNQIVADLAYGYLVRPNSSLSAAEFGVYDKETGMIYVIDSNGSSTSTFFDGAEAFEGMFTFSNGGARLVYVGGTVANQEIVIAGVKTDDLQSVITLDETQTFYGRPTVDIAGDATEIAMMVENVDETTMIVSYDRNGDHRGRILETPVQALAFSPNGDHLAFINPETRDLLIYNAGLTTEEHVLDFSPFGNGATALSWSPDNGMIAFFAGSAAKLLVYTLNGETVQQIQFDGTYVLPIGTDKLWAQPTWNSASTELVFTAFSGEGTYDIVKVDLLGNMTVLFEDVGDTHYVEWIEED